MALGQGHAQDVLDHRAESDPGHAEQATGQFRVEQGGGGQTQLGQAGQVLAGCVQDPLRAAQGPRKARDTGDGMRVDQRAAGPLTADLDQVGALAVPVPGGALGVHRDRSGAGQEVAHDSVEVRLGLGDARQPVAKLERGQRRGLLGDSLFGVDQGGGLGHGVTVPAPGLGLTNRTADPGRLQRPRQATTPWRKPIATISARSPVPSLRPIRAR